MSRHQNTDLIEAQELLQLALADALRLDLPEVKIIKQLLLKLATLSAS